MKDLRDYVANNLVMTRIRVLVGPDNLNFTTSAEKVSDHLATGEAFSKTRCPFVYSILTNDNCSAYIML